MYISRVLIRNFRNFGHLDVPLRPGVTCIVGQNNAGKSNLLHAVRLATDPTLSYQQRRLGFQDFRTGCDPTKPEHVLVCVEFRDFANKPFEEAMVGEWALDGGDCARLMFRFRPSRRVREEIADKQRPPDGLTPEDYRVEFCGGGAGDPATASWEDSLGRTVNFNDLQQFLVTALAPLRDVEQSLRQARSSPLGKLLEASSIPATEQTALVALLADANKKIAASPSIKDIGTDVSQSFATTAGAFSMKVSLGMSAPDFSSISRGLFPLLTNDAVASMDPSRNGLGLNNVLFMVLLLRSFEVRLKNATTPGQLLLIEEPEAHLHPQLQRILFSSLQGKPFQVIVTTHSTHITSQVPIGSTIILTDLGIEGSRAYVPAVGPLLSPRDAGDLERYLDATRATLLYAKRVLLVEGPAELFLIPALVKSAMNIDLEERGISIVPIFGVHFDAYAKLFGPDAMAKKCAIVADADLIPSDAGDVDGDDLPPLVKPDLTALENAFVRVFLGTTTFEREVTDLTTLPMYIAAFEELGATKTTARLTKLLKDAPDAKVHPKALALARDLVLRSAKRVGKARLAQIASKHVGNGATLPKYVRAAVEWLVAD